MTDQLRVLGYLRISRETEESTSLDRQRADVERVAKRLGGEVVAWAEDPSVSGSKPPYARPGLGPWLDEPKSRSWDVLVAYHTDRVARDTVETLLFVRWLRDNGKRLVTASDGTDTSNAENDLALTVLAGVAEKERSATVRRVLNARTALRKEGRHGAGPAPYGYTLERREGGGWSWAVDPRASEALVDAVNSVIEGESLHSICARFNTASVPPPASAARTREGRPGRWHAGTLHKILRRRTLLGQSTHKGELVTADGMPVQFGPPLVDRNTWEKLQAALDGRDKAHPRKHVSSLLYGLVRCVTCESLMVGTGTGKRVTYTCREPGHSNTVLRHIAEDVVTSEILTHVWEWPVVYHEWVYPEDHSSRVQELYTAIDRLVDSLAEGTITSERARARMNTKVEEYQAEADRLVELDQGSEPWLKTIETGRTWGEEWQNSDVAGKRGLLGALIEDVWVSPPNGGKPADRVWVDTGEEDF